MNYFPDIHSNFIAPHLSAPKGVPHKQKRTTATDLIDKFSHDKIGATSHKVEVKGSNLTLLPTEADSEMRNLPPLCEKLQIGNRFISTRTLTRLSVEPSNITDSSS